MKRLSLFIVCLWMAAPVVASLEKIHRRYVAGDCGKEAFDAMMNFQDSGFQTVLKLSEKMYQDCQTFPSLKTGIPHIKKLNFVRVSSKKERMNYYRNLVQGVYSGKGDIRLSVFGKDSNRWLSYFSCSISDKKTGSCSLGDIRFKGDMFEIFSFRLSRLFPYGRYKVEVHQKGKLLGSYHFLWSSTGLFNHANFQTLSYTRKSGLDFQWEFSRPFSKNRKHVFWGRGNRMKQSRPTSFMRQLKIQQRGKENIELSLSSRKYHITLIHDSHIDLGEVGFTTRSMTYKELNVVSSQERK